MTDQQYPSGKRIREMMKVTAPLEPKLSDGGVWDSPWQAIYKLGNRVDALEQGASLQEMQRTIDELSKSVFDLQQMAWSGGKTIANFERGQSDDDPIPTVDNLKIEIEQLEADNSVLEANIQRVWRDCDHYGYLNEQLKLKVEDFKIENARLTVNLADSQAVTSFYAAKVDNLERRCAEYVEQIEKLKAAGND